MNVITEAIQKQTEAGRLAHAYLVSGDTVPDKLVFDMMSAKLASAAVAHQGTS